MEVQARFYDEDHPFLLHEQYEPALGFRVTKQCDKAVDLLEHIVKVQARQLDENHSGGPASRYGCAKAFQSTYGIAEALDMLEHVV